jgi:valyl-tRNA synthetase
MSTGFDIIFFWVARMIMMGLKFRGRIPFRHVFINGLVRDLKRRKMSKSEGNIIDPLEMIGKYGTDALRFTLAALAVPGMDLALSEERMAGYQAFANKIWNASRFVLMNLGDQPADVKESELALADRWIRSRLAAITASVTQSLEQYKFYEAADSLYHFIWHEFCDWYLELAKVGMREGNKTTEAVLADTLDRILRLLHPFMPFITEEIWQHLPGAGRSICVAPFPEVREDWRDAEAEKAMALLQEAVVEVRKIRTENKISPKDKLELWVKSAEGEETRSLRAEASSLQALAGVSKLEFASVFPAGKRVLKGVAGPFELAIPLEDTANLAQEKERLEKELQKILADIEKVERKLGNADFVAKAPAAVVDENRGRLDGLKDRRDKIRKNLSHLPPAA